MTVDLILHGVPNGQDMWGVNDDTHYFSTFYVQRNEKEILTIEIRKVSGKSYCYYNYLKYNGMIASDERAGAYLGITLRFDAYYRHVLNVYHLCEIIYSNLLDTILIKNGDNIKFKIAKFEDANRELNEIKKKTFNLINLSVTAKDFISINDSFFKNDGKIIRAFLLDCTPDNVMQVLVKYGKVEISKYIPSINEEKKLRSIEERFSTTITQKDKELQDIGKQNEDLKKEKSSLQNELENKKDEVILLNNIISEKENIIKRNEENAKKVDTLRKETQELKNKLQERSQEIERLGAKLHQYKDNKKISDLVKDIKTPLNILAEVAGRQFTRFPYNNSNSANEDNYTTDTEYKKNSKKGNHFWDTPIWQAFKIVLLILTLCSSLFCVYKLSIHHNDGREEKQIKAYSLSTRNVNTLELHQEKKDTLNNKKEINDEEK